MIGRILAAGPALASALVVVGRLRPRIARSNPSQSYRDYSPLCPGADWQLCRDDPDAVRVQNQDLAFYKIKTEINYNI